ncbi:MAG: ABC transporter substrate-binding protein [Rhodospirillales bacterium]|nr:ABC transporter substrate-binding protein [Rhodospirillales bacterium]
MNTSVRRSWAMWLAGAVLALPLFAASASAQQTFVIAGFGGPNEAIMRKTLIPEFEKANNVKVEWLPASSTQNHGRIKAQKANPQVDVILLDYMVQVLASKEDLLAPLDPKLVPNLADIRKEGRLDGDKGVGFGINYVVMVYNSKIFKDKKIPEPTSWNDLLNPAAKGRVSVRHITSSYGLVPMIMLAYMNGGSEKSIEPGFNKFKELAPNVLEFSTTGGQSEQFMISGDAWLAAMGADNAMAVMAKNPDLKTVIPKEGTIYMLTTANVVKGAPKAELAQKFVNAMLTPKGQQQVANAFMYMPTSTKVSGNDVKQYLPYDPSVKFKETIIDDLYVSQNREAWVEKFNKEVLKK